MTSGRDLQGALRDPYDLVIVGGGALGCAMSWEAASRGLRVALLEKDDFGSGTSANSLRIVHGGLRYLQKIDIRRTRTSAAERSAMLRIAPHLIVPLRCVLPALPGWKRSRAAILCGLAANAALTSDRNRGLDPERHLAAGGLLSRSRLAALAPGIDWRGSTGGGYWYDAFMLDSERLALAFAMSARSSGATVANHIHVVDVLRSRQGLAGVIARDTLSGQFHEVHAQAIADCRGPWMMDTDCLSGRDGDVCQDSLIKAINVVVTTPEPACAIAFPARTEAGEPIPGRLFFAVPFHGATAVGTWYFDTDQRPDNLRLAPKERDTILADLGRSCPGWEVSPDSLRAVHLGLLPRHPGQDQNGPMPAERPSLHRDCSRGVTAGVWRLGTEKWTTVRRLSQIAIDRIAQDHKLTVARSSTTTRPLHGADFGSLRALRSQAACLRPDVLSEHVVARLITRFGREALSILNQVSANPSSSRVLPGTNTVTKAEFDHVLSGEMPATVADMALRRLGLGETGRPNAVTLEFIAAEMASRLGWSEDQKMQNIEAVQAHPGFQVI